MNAQIKADTAAQLIEVTRQIKALTEQKELLQQLVFSEYGKDKASITVPGHGRVNIIAESISEALDPFTALAEILGVSLDSEKTKKQNAAVLEVALAEGGITPPKTLSIRQASIRVTVNS